MVDRIPAIIVFGNTGSGKSTLSNILVGMENAFQESEDVVKYFSRYGKCFPRK